MWFAAARVVVARTEQQGAVMATTEDFLAWLERDLRRAGGIEKVVEVVSAENGAIAVRRSAYST